MADILEFKTRRQLQAQKLREKMAECDEIAAATASDIVKEAMPDLIEVYNSYGLRFDDTERNFRHFSAIQLLLYIHTCSQVGFDHPMIDYLDEVSEEMEEMVEICKDIIKDD